MSKRLKVLALAYACNPFRGSEDGVGWGWVHAASRYHDVWVLTAEHHRRDIGRAIAEDPDRFRNLRFVFVPHKAWRYSPVKTWLAIENSCLKPLMNLAYQAWLGDAFQVARKLHRDVDFDLVHQVTYVGFRFPGHLWKLEIPFVWGPVGGLVNVPWSVLPVMGLRGCLEYAGRNMVNTAQKVLLPGPKKAFRKAAAVIAATSGVREEIKKWYGRESKVVCEIGPPPETANFHSFRKEGDLFRLAWSGQHLPGKALPLLLNALARLGHGVDLRLDILGEGPFTSKWQKQSVRLGLAGRCRWHGWVERCQSLRVMRNAHAFVITSMKDLTSTVLLEALANGLPVICPDHCGFADVVTEDCGIKIPVIGRRQFEGELAAAIAKLSGDETLRRCLAKGALARVSEYSWERKAERLDEIYRELSTHRECSGQ